MNGIRLIRLLDVLPVTAAENAPGMSPRSLLLTVDGDLQNVEQVVLNGMMSPAFVRISDNQIIARVPPEIEQDTISDLAVLSVAPSLTSSSVMQFGLGIRVGRVRGVQRLLQTFARLLMRTRGSNGFHPGLGGGLGRIAGQNYDRFTAAQVTLAITSVREQIMAAQSLDTSIPPNERLLTAEIASIAPDVENGALYVTIAVTTYDQRRAAATLVA